MHLQAQTQTQTHNAFVVIYSAKYSILVFWCMGYFVISRAFYFYCGIECMITNDDNANCFNCGRPRMHQRDMMLCDRVTLLFFSPHHLFTRALFPRFVFVKTERKNFSQYITVKCNTNYDINHVEASRSDLYPTQSIFIVILYICSATLV